MKTPFNVLRHVNQWERAPRDPVTVGAAILGSLGSFGTAIAGISILGVSGAAIVGYLATTAITSWALSALAPDVGGIGGSRGLMVNATDPAAPHDIVYGTVRKGGIRTYVESTGDENKFLHMILVLAGHELAGIDDIYLNDEIVTLDGSGFVTSGGWAENGNKVRIKKHLGSQTAPDADLLAESNQIDANFVGNGIAYLYIRLEYDQDVFANGIPLVTAKVRGRKVYDPRDTSTAFSANAALCVRDYLTADFGLNDTSVLEASFSTSAAVSDEQVEIGSTGVFLSRYETNGVVSSDMTPREIVTRMMTACGGTLFWGQGNWQIHVGYYSNPVKTFTLDDLRGPISLDTRASARDNFNRVVGTFSSAKAGYIVSDYKPVSPQEFLTEDGGVENTLDLPLPFTTSANAARRLAKMTLFRAREQMTFSADFGLEAFSVQVGDIVAFDNSRYGWTGKEFEVVGWRFETSGEGGDLRVNLTLRETSEAAFAWDGEVSDIISNNTTLPSPRTNLTINGLAVNGGGRTTADGTFIESAILSWTAAANAFVTSYDIQWKPVVDSSYAATTTNNATIEISPLIDGVEYVFSVRARLAGGGTGPWSSITFTGGGDVTAPNVPTLDEPIGTLGFINVYWTNPADSDFSHVEIWESDTSSFSAAVKIAEAFGDAFSRGNLGPLMTKYYWIRSVDFSGNKSAFVGPVSATTSQITNADLGPATIQYDNFATDVVDLFDVIASDISVRVLKSDYNITVDYQQQLEDATTQLAEDALTLALNASSLESRINDAGITVDPATGSVTIQGLSAVEGRVNTVEIDLDAVEGELILKASTTYVNNAIAAATLPEATLDSLDELEARVETVEIDLNVVEGSITLTSTGSFYNVNDGVLGVEAIEGRVSIAEGQITLKASQTDLTDVTTRLGTAEIALSTLDAPSITLAVQDVRQISEAQADLGTLTLQEVLGRYNDREYILQDVAYARMSLTADVTEQGEAISTLTTELASQIANAEASIFSEQQTRVSADSAIASDLTQLNSQVNDPVTGLPAAQSSIVTLNETKVTAAEATSIAQSEITSSLASEDAGTIGASINTLEATKVTAAEATSIAQSEITSSLASEDAGTIGASINTLEATKVTAAEATSIAQSEITSSLASEDAGTIGASINTLEATKVTAAEATSIAQSEITSSLASEDAGTIGASINTLEATKVTAEGALAAVNTEIGAEYDGLSGLVAVTGEAKAGVDGIEAKYGVSIDNNGNASGFQLLSGVGGSAFNVRADQFAVWDVDGNGGAAPFTVFTSSRTIDGVVYPAGTYIENAIIDEAAIINGSITNAKIKELSADKITVGTLSADRISIDGLTLDTNASGELIVAESGITRTNLEDGSVSGVDANTQASLYVTTNTLIYSPAWSVGLVSPLELRFVGWSMALRKPTTVYWGFAQVERRIKNGNNWGDWVKVAEYTAQYQTPSQFVENAEIQAGGEVLAGNFSDVEYRVGGRMDKYSGTAPSYFSLILNIYMNFYQVFK